MKKIVKIYFKNQKYNNVSSIGEVCSIFNAQRYEFLEDSRFSFSCAFPFKANELFLPKPALISKELLNLTTKEQKHLRNTEFISVTCVDDFFNGKYDFAKESKFSFCNYYNENGKEYIELLEDVGIYFVIDFIENSDIFHEKINKIILQSFSKTVYNFEILDLPENLKMRVSDKYTYYITLAPVLTSNIDEQRLSDLLSDGGYHFKKEKTYSKNYEIVLDSGSCFKRENIQEDLNCFMVGIL